MPSATLQSRINLFEQSSSPPVPINTPHPSSPPTLLLESPLSPKIASMRPMAPSTNSSAEFVTGSSLIDLKDWVIDDNHYNKHTQRPSSSPTAPLIHLQSPPKPKPIPPLPPRKPSYTSLKSVSSESTGSPSQSLKAPSRRTDSLTVEYSYSPNGSNKRPSPSPGHMPASSVSSFHSVSLSSDGEPMTPASGLVKLEPSDTGASSKASTSESFEDVSASSIVSPSTAALMVKQGNASRPPKLPQRPSPNLTPSTPPVLKSSQSSSSSVTTLRRAPPPRPGSSPRSSFTSDHSSILSSAASITSRSSNSSRTSLNKFSSQKAVFPVKRPTPIPPAARARFEQVFNGNVQQLQKVEQQRLRANYGAEKKKSGWRGLSVDLITNPELTTGSSNCLNDNGSDERLEGYIVRAIWSRSRLDDGLLRAIWNECDTQHMGSLNKEEFIRGMWRIDEELGRARLKSYKGPTKRSSRPNATSHR